MLKSTITVVNSGSQGEDVIGSGFHEYFEGNSTSTFSIDFFLAANAVADIELASSKLSASAGGPVDDGDSHEPLEAIPYGERGAKGGVAALDENGDVAITGGDAVLNRIGVAVADNSTKPSAADDDAIATQQSPGAAGDLTLDGADVSGGAVEFDVPRAVTITSDSNNSGVTVTITGTDENGDAATEDLTGPNVGTVTSTKWFSTVTAIAVDAAGTNLKVGKAAGLVIIDLDDGNVQKITIGADCTIEFENWKATGIMDALILRIDNTDNHTITWTGVDLWGAGAVPAFGAANVEVLDVYTMDGGTTVEAIIKAADMSAAS